MSHLRRVGTYKQTLAKHKALVIYTCVRKCLENSSSDSLDLAVEFEHLKNFENIDDFIEYLEKQHTISKSYSDGLRRDLALEDLQEHAKNLGRTVQIIDKNEVVINKDEYFYLKRLEERVKELSETANHWPLSLVM
jgi:hypothetical protein